MEDVYQFIFTLLYSVDQYPPNIKVSFLIDLLLSLIMTFYLESLSSLDIISQKEVSSFCCTVSFNLLLSFVAESAIMGSCGGICRQRACYNDIQLDQHVR